MAGEAKDKGTYRRDRRLTLRALSPQARSRGSTFIVNELAARLPANALCALFCGTSHEPDLSALFEERPDLKLAYPRVNGPGLMTFYHTPSFSVLTPGSFGILEPDPSFPIAAAYELDAVVCPGLAFTAEGRRLGQGGGFYDRYLTKVRKAWVVGVGFQCQLVDFLPHEEHDVLVDDLILSLE